MKNIFNLKELSRRDIPPVSEIQKLFENTSEEDFAGYVDFIIENQKLQYNYKTSNELFMANNCSYMYFRKNKKRFNEG